MENENNNMKNESKDTIKNSKTDFSNTEKGNKKKILIAGALIIVVAIIVTAIILLGKSKGENNNNNNNNSNNTNAQNEQNEQNEQKAIAIEDNVTPNNITPKKIEIPVESKLLVACSLANFDKVEDLAVEALLQGIAVGLNNKWIDLKGEQTEEGLVYTEEQITNAVYSVFGVDLKENKSTGGMIFKDGKYIITLEKDNNIPEIKNLKGDPAAGTVYYEFDIYVKEGNESVLVGSFQGAMANDIIKFKKSVEKVVEENQESETVEWKEAYKEQLKKFYEEKDKSEENDIFTEYGLADIDKDDIPELLIRNFTCEADMKMYYYTYKDGKVEELGSLGSSHTGYYIMNNEKYILAVNGHMGYETVQKIYIDGNSIKTENISNKQLADDENYTEGDEYIEEVKWNDTTIIENY